MLAPSHSLVALALPLALAATLLEPAPQAAELELPVARHAWALEHDTEGVALEVRASGAIFAGGEPLHDPARELTGDTPDVLRAWLARRSAHMPRRPAGLDRGSPALPDGRVLVRADAAAPFAAVRRVLQRCGTVDVRLWRTELAVRLAGSDEPASFAVHLPIDPGGVGRPTPSPLVLRVEPFTVGGRRDVVCEVEDERLDSLAELRERLAEPGPRPSTAHIDARGDLTVAEVLAVLDLLRGAGCGTFGFVGSDD